MVEMPSENEEKFDLRFKVNLRGIIELLSNHLYSNPKVFVRELLQNAVDAITARNKTDINFEGEITFELYEATKDEKGVLIIEDNGIGLTEDELHQFLAVIGQSSKKEDFFTNRDDFIGQFGIGLLSCFMVCDEIVLITRSIKASETFEWIGKSDGTYTVRKLEEGISPGTKLFLRSKIGSEEYFKTHVLRELLIHYGCFLPYSIFFSDKKSKVLINDERPFDFNNDGIRYADHEKILSYGEKAFGEKFIDFIPLSSSDKSVSGVAYIISHTMNPSAKRKHRVLIKNMFLSENIENLLPDWAFFVKCIINANNLQPTASREGLYEDDKLIAVRNELSNSIRSYLKNKAEFDMPYIKKIISVHSLSIKALAIEYDDLYKLFLNWLPFETSLGELTLEDILKQSKTILYTPNIDEFRQIQRISAAKSMCILNSGYIYDTEIIEKIPRVLNNISIERISPTEISESFEELNFSEREQVYNFINNANIVLQPYKCSAQIKKFIPSEIPALYIINEDTNFLRAVENTKEMALPLFSSILEGLSQKVSSISCAQLCFNYDNSLIIKLVETNDTKLIGMSIEIIYIQSLLMGHHPLTKKELNSLNKSLLNLIDYKL